MNMTEDENDAVIVRSTVDLSRNLGLKVVAEGVETEDVWRALAALGCDLAQGYYLTKPIPAAALTAWFRDGEPATEAADGGTKSAMPRKLIFPRTLPSTGS
jgi:EAL domain-containing protein (putative c-di-GMP-specific phosphodiesterase class I)